MRYRNQVYSNHDCDYTGGRTVEVLKSPRATPVPTRSCIAIGVGSASLGRWPCRWRLGVCGDARLLIFLRVFSCSHIHDPHREKLRLARAAASARARSAPEARGGARSAERRTAALRWVPRSGAQSAAPAAG